MSVLTGTLAWGCWRLDNDDVGQIIACLEACTEAGITVIDTAPVYGYGSEFGVGHAERMLGRAFAKRPELRERFTVVTKAGLDLPVPYDSSAQRLREECRTSLQALDDTTIDVYLIHRPDLLTSWGQLAETLDGLVESGQVRHLGVSNFTPAQVNALGTKLNAPLTTHQFECSLLHIDPICDGTLDQTQELDLAAMAWSPLAGGRLFAENTKSAVVDRCRKLANEKDQSIARIALSFLLKLPAVMPIIGTMKPERIVDTGQASGGSLTRSEWYELMSAARGAPMP